MVAVEQVQEDQLVLTLVEQVRPTKAMLVVLVLLVALTQAAVAVVLVQ